MELWSLNITVSYELRDEADLDETIAGIEAFVGAVAAGHPGVLYVSGQSLENPRAFRHTIRVRSKEELGGRE